MATEIPLTSSLKSASGSNTTRPNDPYSGSNQGSGNTSQQPLRMRGTRTHDNGNFTSVDQSVFTENTTVPRRNLGFIQVTSLMLNGCLGNGFYFTTPGYVLALVRSKRVCLVLWAIGGIYSALGMTVFLEYGMALPFNGGPLVYLDVVFRRPRLLATVIFSLWWILFASTEGSSKSVAQTILTLASGRSVFELEDGLIQYTGVVVITVVCLMLFFAPRLCFAFNAVSALYKIILMLVIFIAGMAASRGANSGWHDFNVEFPGYNSKEVLTAMVYIIECYQGWDNANYVSGEISDCKRTLKWAGITAISILTCLNMLVTLAFFGVSDYATLTNDEGQANVALQFAQIVFHSTKGMQVATGLSAFMNLLFVTYTSARVKQAIAWQRIIPFSSFFGSHSMQFDSPGGGLFLHWIFTIIPLLFLGKMHSDGRIFVTGLFQYGYEILTVFMAIGLFRLKSRMRLSNPLWDHTYLKNPLLLASVALTFAGLNIVVMVMTALPVDEGRIPRFYWAVAMGGLAAAGTLYWAFFRLFQANDPKRRWNVASKMGVEVFIYEDGDEVPDEMDLPMFEAAADGSRRRLDYKLSGPIGICFARMKQLKNFLLRELSY
ncbi:amino acid permease-domain-containing protein [Lophiotrema nucula]|uniref:Amino acid permease-domain-containing protein n=1 Tax=Lophiotrema nucula TaxID=690887 RepID=A0A6A5YNX2_9PLEO|nr:amino acid permease-domain-containing protein [Lophiotrema nucula]